MAADGRGIAIDSLSLAELVEQADDGRLIIPPFQRDVVWEQERMLALWDSMYRSYPIGSLLCWRTTTALEMIRAVGGAPLDPSATNARPDHGYVLDGQQRLTAIYAGMKGGVGRVASRRNENYTLYFDATADLAGSDADGAVADALDLEEDIFTGREDKPAQSPHFLFENKARASQQAHPGGAVN
jgi:hypothetical protein